jgi:hypothetical protein
MKRASTIGYPEFEIKFSVSQYRAVRHYVFRDGIASQILTVRSADADASRVESYEKATELT